jgi:magnesium chelatase family protein
MISKVQSAVISGIEGQMIELETHIANGMPNHVIVGLPGQVVKESKERVKSALKVMGIRFPDTRITQNLYPAYLRKEGAHLDLPMAVGILTCMGRMNQADKRFGFIGELSLEGHIRPIKGALSLIEGMKHAGITHIVLPEGNLNEGRYVDSVSLYPFQTLEAMVAAFESDSLSPCTPENPSFESIIQAEHFRDVIGQ